MKQIITRTQAIAIINQANQRIQPINMFLEVKENDPLKKKDNVYLEKQLLNFMDEDNFAGVVDDPVDIK